MYNAYITRLKNVRPQFKFFLTLALENFGQKQ